MPQVWHYGYDVLGRRISKERSENGEFLPHSKTEFIWDGSHLVQEIDHGSDTIHSYIYTHPNSYEPLAQLAFAKNNKNPTACYYYHNDPIGIPRELTDEQGKRCWVGSYNGWGKLTNEQKTSEKIHQPFRLQNQYYDQETGLHYNFFRYYEPNLGRFISLDPIGLAGGMNLYRFEGAVQNNADPLGLFIPALAGAAFLSALEYTATAMTGILIGLGIYEATASDNTEVTGGEITEVTRSSVDTSCAGKCDKPKCPDDEFKKLTNDVNKAKELTGQIGGCKRGMTDKEMKIRSKAWKQLALARSIRETKCWDGGDASHQDEIAKAWKNHYKCEGVW